MKMTVIELVNKFHAFYWTHHLSQTSARLNQSTSSRSISLQHIVTVEGTRWRSWLRHCATSQKDAGSIPDGVIEMFHWHNPSGRTMSLGSTQPLTEMSTRSVSWE
jgi:hypothetical protein